MPETKPSAGPVVTAQPAAAQPTVAQVRAAAEAFKNAIDRHLAAVEARSDELDPAVLDAFDVLAAAAEEYDELLYAVHDEVTPFEVLAETPDAYAGPDEVEAVSVFIRRDYLVADPDLLAAAARSAAEDFDAETGDNRAALAELFDAFDADEIAYRAAELGLESAESTLWLVAAEPEVLGGWQDDPFTEADAERLIYRVDVVEEDDEDEEDELDDEDFDEADELADEASEDEDEEDDEGDEAEDEDA
jgi:hypothetical protein